MVGSDTRSEVGTDNGIGLLTGGNRVRRIYSDTDMLTSCLVLYSLAILISCCFSFGVTKKFICTVLMLVLSHKAIVVIVVIVVLYPIVVIVVIVVI